MPEPWPDLWPWNPPSSPPSFWKEYGRHALLFVFTAASVYVSGGPLLAIGLLSILLAHEMGHYLACRYYGVDATLPFFIPVPVLSLVGTLGAFIRIRSPIPHRRALFDIGIAGPLAGFVVCLPVLVLGVAQSQFVPDDRTTQGMLLGDPLLFQWIVLLIHGKGPSDMTLSLGPLGLAAWFGLFVTALNLIPVGQLDGGHVSYALLGRRARVISHLGIAACLGLLYLRPTWLLWCVLLLLLGRRPHPRTLNDYAPVGAGRIAVGVLGLVVLILCFTPSPILVTWSDFFQSLSALGQALTSR